MSVWCVESDSGKERLCSCRKLRGAWAAVISNVRTKPLVLLRAESKEHGGKDDKNLRSVSEIKGSAKWNKTLEEAFDYRAALNSLSCNKAKVMYGNLERIYGKQISAEVRVFGPFPWESLEQPENVQRSRCSTLRSNRVLSRTIHTHCRCNKLIAEEIKE